MYFSMPVMMACLKVDQRSSTLHVIAMSWILLWIEIMWSWKLHQSALLNRGIFLLAWLIRGTSREASTTSWSEIPGLTITFLQEDWLFVIRRSSVLSSLVLW